MRFTANGHPNIRSTHRLTFEFTKDRDVTPKGDCIIGVAADFRLDELKKVLAFPRLRITITVGKDMITATAKTNPDFGSDHEIVVRRGVFVSDRTLGTECDIAARNFLPLLDKLQDPDQVIIVEVDGI
jgi:hypothetical protein